MPVKRIIPYREGVYFITFTCYQWFPLIEKINGYGFVYKWFDHLKDYRHYIVGYQIMPNHVHALIAFRDTGKDINCIIGNGKRFMAYKFVEQLIKSNWREELFRLRNGVNKSDRKRSKQHEIWEDSFDWKECRSSKMILQKLEYMHNNPCTGKWQLAESPVDYLHSSAKFYITGEHGIYPVTHYMELQDIDLTARIKY